MCVSSPRVRAISYQSGETDIEAVFVFRRQEAQSAFVLINEFAHETVSDFLVPTWAR